MRYAPWYDYVEGIRRGSADRPKDCRSFPTASFFFVFFPGRWRDLLEQDFRRFPGEKFDDRIMTHRPVSAVLTRVPKGRDPATTGGGLVIVLHHCHRNFTAA